MVSFSSLRPLEYAVSAAALAVASIVGYHLYSHHRRSGEPPIKWSWLPYFGNAMEMGVRPMEFLRACAEEFGEIFGLIVAGNRMFIIASPHSHNVIIKPSKSLSTSEFHNMVIANFFGVRKCTILDHAMDEDLMRSYYSKYLFSEAGLGDLTERMQAHLASSLCKLEPGSYKLQTFLNRFIFAASVASLFDEEVANKQELYPAFLEFDKMLPLAVAGVDLAYFSKALQSRNALVAACMHPPSKSSTLSEFLKKRGEYLWSLVSQKKLNDEDAAKYQLGMLWASVGNTMPAVFWMMFFLLSSPEAMQSARREVESLNGNLSQENLNHLLYLDACITEALRLSSGSLIMRVVTQPCTITLDSGASYKLRKGDRLGICPPLTHHDPEVFHDPETFIPERWLVGDSEEARIQGSLGKIPLQKDGKELSASLAFLPFGGGVSYCPGRRFARNEIKTLVAYLLTHFTMSLQQSDGKCEHPGYDGARCGLGIFPPKNDVDVIVARKSF